MKLSEAIRLGAMLRPKADGYFYNQGASCALGAALEASGIQIEQAWKHANSSLESRWQWIISRDVSCPVCGIGDTARNLIPHLNNTSQLYGRPKDHGWTRDQIADWVATIEAQQEQAAPVETPVAAAQV